MRTFSTAGYPRKRRKPAKSRTTGRLIRSVAAWSAVSASASSWVRSDAALAASEARTLAPSVPARATEAASSDSSSTPSSWPSRPRADHGVWRARRASSSARRREANVHPDPTEAASTVPSRHHHRQPKPRRRDLRSSRGRGGSHGAAEPRRARMPRSGAKNPTTMQTSDPQSGRAMGRRIPPAASRAAIAGTKRSPTSPRVTFSAR